MKYLVDSDWIADYLGGKEPAVALLDRLAPEGIAISLMTFGEIYEGIYYGRDPKKAEAQFREFLRAVDILPLTRRILRRFARIRGHLRRQGELIGDPDILIAGTISGFPALSCTTESRIISIFPSRRNTAPHRSPRAASSPLPVDVG